MFGSNIANTLNTFMMEVKSEKHFIKYKNGIRYFFFLVHEESPQFFGKDHSIFDLMVEDQLSQVLHPSWTDTGKRDSSDDIRMHLSKIYSIMMYGGVCVHLRSELDKAFMLQLIYSYGVKQEILFGLSHEILQDKTLFYRLINCYRGNDKRFTQDDFETRIRCYDSLVKLSQLILSHKAGSSEINFSTIIVNTKPFQDDWYDIEDLCYEFNSDVKDTRVIKHCPKLIEEIDVLEYDESKDEFINAKVKRVIPLLMFAYEDISQLSTVDTFKSRILNAIKEVVTDENLAHKFYQEVYEKLSIKMRFVPCYKDFDIERKFDREKYSVLMRKVDGDHYFNSKIRIGIIKEESN